EARGLAAEQQVLGDGEIRHQHQLLVDHGDARPLRVRRAAEALHLPAHAHLAAVAPERVHAGEHLEQRRLARAVLAAEPEDLPSPGGQLRARERADAAEALLDAAKLEQRGDQGARMATLCAPSETLI